MHPLRDDPLFQAFQREWVEVFGELPPEKFAEQLQVEDDPRFVRKAWIAMFCGTVAFWIVVLVAVFV